MSFFLLRPALTGHIAVNGFLTVDECRGLIEGGERSLKLAPGATEDRRTSLRRSDVGWFSPDNEYRWLFEKIADCVNNINAHWFGYQLLGFEGIQFTKYSSSKGDPGGFYSAHKDTALLPGGTIRKLSFTIQLSDPHSYEGGDVVLYDSFSDSATLARSVGSISFFPSYTIHEVTPVTKGARYSLVGWACGPAFT